MYIIAQRVAEKENKGKAKKISFAVHLVLLLLLLIPIIRPDLTQKDFERAITIEFEQSFDRATKKSGAGQQAIKPAAAAPREKVELAQIQQPKVAEKTTFEVPERKEIITMDVPEIPVPEVQETNSTDWDTPVEEAEIVEETPELLPEPVEEIPEPVEEIVPVIEEVEEEAEPDVDPSWSDGIAGFGTGDSKSETGGDGNSDDGELSGKGKGDGDAGDGTGKGDPGKDTGEGNKGTDNFWGTGDGNGQLSRKVIKYKDSKQLAGFTGKVVLNICVNRPGRVVFAEYDATKSTVTDLDIIRKVQALVTEYEFEQDYSAPTQQCGKYTFKYSVDN